MKIKRICLSILFLTAPFGVNAGGSQYTQEYLNNACNYLGSFCEIVKLKCISEELPNLDECLVDYTIKIINAQSISQESADLRNERYAQEACEILGDECDFVQLECLVGGGLFNTCVAMSYFKIEVFKEQCGVRDYRECLERDREFGVKVVHELTIPNIGRPIKRKMEEECTHAGNYKVKSMELKEFYYGYMGNLKYLKEPIVLSGDDDYEYKSQEDYYNCMKAVLEKAY